MKAIVYTAPKTVELQEVPIPEVKEGWALVKVSHVGVCGTDLTIYSGTHPRATAPVILGHEFSGVVAKGHPTLKEGTLVNCFPLIKCGHCEPCLNGAYNVCKSVKYIGLDLPGGMAEYVLIPVDHILPLPEGVNLKLGAFIEPLAVAVHTVRKSGYIPGDNAVVFGCGTIGLVVALTLRKYGCNNLTIVDVNDSRLDIAKSMGFNVLNSEEVNVPEEIAKITNNIKADYVFDCAGHPSVLKNLIETVKILGTVVGVSTYKALPEINMTLCMFKELRMQFVRNTLMKDFDIAQQLIKEDIPNYEKIITHVLQPEEVQKGFDLLTSKSDAIKVMYNFE